MAAGTAKEGRSPSGPRSPGGGNGALPGEQVDAGSGTEDG